MNVQPEQFPFVHRDPTLGNASLAAMLPLTLVGMHRVTAMGLVDTGASINVLPLSLGKALGFDWGQQNLKVELTGNLASVDARVVAVSAAFGSFSPIKLAFAWANSDAMSVILGQVNFFMEFDVCFFRTRAFFEVRPKQTV